MKTMLGLQPDTPIPRRKRVFAGTPVHIPPPRRVHRRPPSALSPRGEQVLAGLVVCYLLAFLMAATVWL